LDEFDEFNAQDYELLMYELEQEMLKEMTQAGKTKKRNNRKTKNRIEKKYMIDIFEHFISFIMFV
jgi:hypothetical protein